VSAGNAADGNAGGDRPWTVPGGLPMKEPLSDQGSHDKRATMFDGGGDAPAASTATVPPSTPKQRGGDGSRRRGGRGGGRGGDDGSRETPMVPKATFTSYYGRPVLKPPVWKDDIAYYFFLGGLAAGSSLLSAGADLTGRTALRRGTRVGAITALSGGTFFLIHDLGRPERFLNMLRVAKPTSPMSMGTWILLAYGPLAGAAAASELLPARIRRTPLGRLVEILARPAGVGAAAVAPLVAGYTSALLSQTAVPAWHAAHPELPFVFTGSAAASAGGLGMIVAPPHEAAPARRLAMYGALVEFAASRQLESRLGLVGEAYHEGEAGKDLQKASVLTLAGVLGSSLLGRRSRIASVLSGAALLAGGFYERLGLFHAGVASAKDPRHTVEPQRRRIEEHGGTRESD
jgi:hypothetical protein